MNGGFAVYTENYLKYLKKIKQTFSLCSRSPFIFKFQLKKNFIPSFDDYQQTNILLQNFYRITGIGFLIYIPQTSSPDGVF